MGENKKRAMSIHDLSEPHQQMIEAMKSQLLIAFLKRLGGRVVMPVSEVDATGDSNFAFSLDVEARTFVFEIQKKH